MKCPIYACTKTLPHPDAIMCVYHWRHVRARLKARLLSNYTAGQRDDPALESRHWEPMVSRVITDAYFAAQFRNSPLLG